MELRNYYQTLGLKNDATLDDIKSAYRTLAKKYHPDINKDPDATVYFKRVNTAYNFLMDPNKKRQLDLALSKPAGQRSSSNVSITINGVTYTINNDGEVTTHGNPWNIRRRTRNTSTYTFYNS